MADNAEPHYVLEAFKDGKFRAAEHYALQLATQLCLSHAGISHGSLRQMTSLVDPNAACAGIYFEPGVALERRYRRGEFRQVIQQHRLRLQTAGLDSKGEPMTGLPAWAQEANARARAQAKAGAGDRLPSEDENPHADWPAGARFKASIEPEALEVLGGPTHPIGYYDAATLEQFLCPVLAVYRMHHPTVGQQVDRILEWVRWWVDQDARNPP